MKVFVISPGMYTYGAMVIAGIVRDAGHEVTLTRRLEAAPEETVFLSLYSTQNLMDEGIRSFISEYQKTGGRVYVGGPVSAVPEMVLGELAPDAVICGEGEEGALALLRDGVSETVPGIAFMGPTGIVFSGPAQPCPVSRPLPFIPSDIAMQDVRGAAAYIETQRGCIGACTFCQVPRFFGREIRSRPLDEILTEVQAFKDAGARRLSVSGGTGSLYGYADGKLNDDAFAELLQGMAGIMGPKNVSSPDIRVDCISDTVLDAIRDYTIGWVFFGLESGSDRVLRLMGKGATAAQAGRAIEACRTHGLHVAGSFIVGYPTETAAEYEETKDFIAQYALDDVFISIAEPIPGTPLADLAMRTPEAEHPAFAAHTGEYQSLHLTEAEARSFDLRMHADMFKPGLNVVTDQIFNAYLAEVRKDGETVRRVTNLLRKYA